MLPYIRNSHYRFRTVLCRRWLTKLDCFFPTNRTIHLVHLLFLHGYLFQRRLNLVLSLFFNVLDDFYQHVLSTLKVVSKKIERLQAFLFMVSFSKRLKLKKFNNKLLCSSFSARSMIITISMG